VKIDTRALTPDQLVQLRHKALALVDQHISYRRVGQMLGVHFTSMRDWVKLRREGREEAVARVRPKGPAPATVSLLNARQQADFRRLIVDRRPEQLKLPFMLWTARSVGDLIFERTSIRLAECTVRTYLRNWGFTPQKPARVAIERDEKAVETWVQTTWPNIRKQAKARGAVSVFVDETGIRSDAASRRSYAPRGKTPVIPSPGMRFSFNVICAILPTGEQGFVAFEGSFNTAVFLDFLERLDAQCGHRALDIVLDNHSVHKSRATREWFAQPQRAGRLRPVYLPPYAPQLNPVELLNNDLKTNWVGPLRPPGQRRNASGRGGLPRGPRRVPPTGEVLLSGRKHPLHPR
jgi:transposase